MAEPPTPSEIRARLRAAGIEVPNRGRISGEHMSAYQDLTAADEGADLTAPTEPPAAPAEPPEGASEPGAEVEVRPSRPRPPGRPRSLVDDIRSLAGREPRARGRSGRGRGGRSRARSGRARPKTVHERVSVAPLIEMAWTGLARAAHPVSDYVGKCLAYESPVAGVILEDTIRGTIVDRALQPFARARDKVSNVGALVMLPASIAGLQAAEGLPPGRRALYRAGLIPIAVQGAILQVKVIGPRLQEIIEREQEHSQVLQEAVQMLLSLQMPFLTAEDLGVTILSAEDGQGEDGPLSPEDARDAEARAAQQFMG